VRGATGGFRCSRRRLRRPSPSLSVFVAAEMRGTADSRRWCSVRFPGGGAMVGFVPPALRPPRRARSRAGGGPMRVDAIGSEAVVSDPVASCSGARGRRSSEVWPFGSGDGDGENDRFALLLHRVCGGDAAGGDGVRQDGQRSPGRRPSLPGSEPPSRSGIRSFKSLCAIGAPSILGAMPCFLLAFGSGGDSGDGD